MKEEKLMRKEYEAPEVEIIRLPAEDVIRTSGNNDLELGEGQPMGS